ncbi:DUF1292 domain-containing protein [Peptoniphilus sp.]|jgi:uncharacterized protein YrzB (UPF0473 family)|uniref:DUF1292 domain-containing protein n=1 Tax=Peptoniphilus sp. TaxID=1971214 RepID=UPI003D8DC179
MSEKDLNKDVNCGCDDCGCEDHNHDHDHDHEEGYQTITLTLDDDSELVCIVIGIFECDGEEYIALVPEDEEDGDEVYLYKYKELSEEEVQLDVIESDEEFERVSDMFDEIFNDED